ncbi:unnamed protein product [Chrysoparadoxa australica]
MEKAPELKVKKKTRPPPPMQRTLAIILQSLRGQSIVLELKNDVEIKGVVDFTDQDMNVSLTSARHVAPDGTVQHFSELFVRGVTVRYVHIPDHINVGKNMHSHMHALEHTERKYSKMRR